MLSFLNNRYIGALSLTLLGPTIPHLCSSVTISFVQIEQVDQIDGIRLALESEIVPTPEPTKGSGADAEQRLLPFLPLEEQTGIAQLGPVTPPTDDFTHPVATPEWRIAKKINETAPLNVSNTAGDLQPISINTPKDLMDAPMNLATVASFGALLAISVLGVLIWRRFESVSKPPKITHSIEP